jgi:hypothetical protein
MLRRFLWPVVVSIVCLASAATVDAQEPRTGITAALALSTRYPEAFQDDCGSHVAAAPSIRAHRRLYRMVSAELAVSGLIQMPPGTSSSCGDAVPLEDGDIRRYYDAPRGDVSLAGEARVILTPLNDADGTLRLIGGGAWFPARRSSAWILGAGYRPPTSWGALVLDIERWSVGVDYDLERFRVGAPREHLADGREWQGFWQVRVGITVWSG